MKIAFFSRRVSRFFLIALAICVHTGLQRGWAVPYVVTGNGDWNTSATDTATLAGALHQSNAAANGITFGEDINTATWANWPAGATSGATVIQTSFALTGTINFDLAGHTLGGADLSFVTGSGAFSFTNGTIGTAANDLYFGADGSVNALFDDTTIAAGNITVTGTADTTANLLFSNSTITLNNGNFTVNGAGALPDGGNVADDPRVTLGNTALTGVNTLTISNGGLFVLTSGSSVGVNDIEVTGTGGSSASSLSGLGSITWTGDMTISGGGYVDLASITTNGGPAGSLTLGSAGTAQQLVVSGGKVNEDTTFDGSLLHLEGGMSVLNGSGVRVEDAANITGITDLNIDGSGSKFKLTGLLAYTPGSRNYATSALEITGNLSVDNGGVLALENGWQIDMQQTGQTLSVNGGGIVYVGEDLGKGPSEPDGQGVYMGIRTAIHADVLDLNDGEMHIIGGALVEIATNGVMAGTAGSTANLYLDESAAGSNGNGSSLNIFRDFVVGQNGTANVSVKNGGNVTAGSTVLAQNAGSEARVVIDHLPRTENIEDFYSPGNVAWYITGAGTTDLEQLRSAGDSSLEVRSGLMFIDAGVFSMGAQSNADAGYATGSAGALGVAHFSGGQTELRLHNGLLSNQGSGANSGIGKIIFDSGAYFSGEGRLIAGENIEFRGAVIAPGSRYLYDDKGQEGQHPLIIGKLDMTVNSGNVSIDGGTVYKVAFSEDGTQASQIVVHGGNLDISEGMVVDLYRMVNSRYVIGLVDGGTITGSYTGYSADAFPQYFTLNGKALVQGGGIRSERVFVNGGNISTRIENGNQLVLDVVTGGGNVITKWTGANGNNWNFFDKNWELASTFNTEQFLDGDNVTFDDTATGAPITVNADGVVLAEMNVNGSNDWTFSGGSITTYNSELYSTLTDTSGRLNKVGSGTLTFNNANQFYGGIHMGNAGTTGGTIVLNNERGLGTYDLSNNLRGTAKGTVFVNENSVIQTTAAVNSLQNRFIVEAGKTLDLLVTNASLTVGNDSAYGQGYKDLHGGAFYIEGTVNVDKDLVLRGNSAPTGGALSLIGNGSLVASRLTVENNTSVTAITQAQNDFGYYAGGGGIYSAATTTLGTGLIVRNNDSRGNGGGIFVTGQAGGAAGVLTLSGDTLITDNRSYAAGGGILVDGSGYNGQGTGSLVLDTSAGDITFTGNYDQVDYDDSGQDAVNPPHIINVADSNAVHLAGAATMGLNGNGTVYFYDPISGGKDAMVNVGMNAGDTVTAVFHGSSHYEGATNVGQSTTFRLEEGVTYYNGKPVYGDASQSPAKATYGVAVTRTLGDDGAGGQAYILDDSNWQTDWSALAQSWTLSEGATLTGQGYLGATNVKIAGDLNLDNGQASGYQNTIGTVGIIGNVTVSDTSNWYLSLSTAGDPSAERTTDLVKVAGSVSFDGDDLNAKHIVRVDSMIHGQYLLMETTGGITGYNTKKRETGAEIYWGATNLSQSGIGASAPAQVARAQAVTYVEGNNLYLDLIARNRYVIGNQANGVWQDNGEWEFADNGGTPTPTGGNLTTDWARYDSGPATNIYVNGDMVAFDPSAGNQTYTISGTVRPVDLVILGTGNTITLNGTGSINTLSPELQADIDSTTIVHQGSSLINDYDIPYYTGRLIKLGASTVAFANGANIFTEGIAVGDASTGAQGGTIRFTNGNQLQVGAGKLITFYGDGTLHYATANAGDTTMLQTGITVNSAKTATFNVDPNHTLRQSGRIAGAGAILKTGEGKLTLTQNNTFTGGATFGRGAGDQAGTIEIGANNALGAAFNQAASATSGYVNVVGNGTLTSTGGSHTIGNHFNVAAGGSLTIATTTAANILHLNGSNAGTLNGGAIYVDAGASNQLTVTGNGALDFNNNRAASGGAIYTAHPGLIALGGTGGTAFTFQNNQATTGAGGAVWAAGDVTLGNGNVFLTNNQAATDGGAIYTADGTVTAQSSSWRVTGNKALNGGGGAIYAKNIVFTNSGGNTTLSGNSAAQGGAFYLNNGTLTLNATSAGTVTFDGNTADQGSAAYVTGTDGAVVINATSGNVFFYDTLESDQGSVHDFTKSGAGAVMFANHGSNVSHAYNGAIAVNQGNFRVTHNTQFGTGGAGTTFNLANGAYLTGGGTIGAANSTIAGVISADTDGGLRTEGPGIAHNFFNVGTITFNGNVKLDTGTLIHIDMVANPGAPANDYNAVGTADVLALTGALDTDSTADIDLYNFSFGEYLIVQAGQTVNEDTSKYTFTVHEEQLTDRHVVNMYRGDNANITAAGANDTQYWLKTIRNNIYMYWSGAYNGNWNPYDRNTLTNQNWVNQNIGSGKIAEGHILNRDTAYFGDNRYDYDNDSMGAAVGTSTVNIVKSTDPAASQAEKDGVIVSAMIINNSAVNYTFNNGAISTDSTFEGNVLELPPANYNPGEAPQTLVKQGTGTATFNNAYNHFGGQFLMQGGTVTFSSSNGANSFESLALENGTVNLGNAANTFVNGITYRGNAADARQINFTTAAQLGGSSIAFEQSGVLHALGAVELGNIVTLVNGSSATINLEGSNLLSMTGASNTSGEGNLVINGGVYQIATEAASQNEVTGTTTVNSGAFRAAEGSFYGSTTGGAFTMAAGTTLAGGGTIRSGSFAIGAASGANVIISPDAAVLTTSSASVPTGSQATLTLAATGNVTLQNFTYQYDMGAASATRTGSTPTGDLISVTSGTVVLTGANNVLDLRGPVIEAGQNYLLIDSSSAITSNGSSPVDPSSVFASITNNGSYNEPRLELDVLFGDAGGGAANTNQLWLSVSRNTLDMTWTPATGGTWDQSSSSWYSMQDNKGVHSTVFNDGDYVHFTGTANQSISLASDVIVSGYDVNASGNYTFTGTGGINGKLTDPSIVGKYITNGSLVPDARLQKLGTGTLTLANGDNNFDGGIWLNGGMLSIARAGHIGDGPAGSRQGIHFTGNSTLQSTGADVTLDHLVTIENGVTAGFATDQTLTLTGVIGQNGTGSLTKTGTGSLILTAQSTYSGGTTVAAGTLEITQAALTAGAAGSTVRIADASTFVIGTQADPYTLNNVITNNGAATTTGVMAVRSGGAFAFGSNVAQGTAQGTGFNGTVELYGVSYDIDAITQGFFTGGATLATKTGSAGTVTANTGASDPAKAWDLTSSTVMFDGGSMTWLFGANNSNEGTIAANAITTGTANHTTVELQLPRELTPDTVDINTSNSLFHYQTPVSGDTLLLATSQTDLSGLNTGLLDLKLYVGGVEQTGTETSQVINQRSTDVADAHFDWGTYTTTNNELRVGYKLTQISIYDGETLEVVRETGDMRNFNIELTDKTTNGSVLFKDNSAANDGIVLGHDNTYTGKTTVGENTLLVMGVDHAIGSDAAHTNELDLTAAGSSVQLGATTQIVGKLTIGTSPNTHTGTLNLGTGSLTVDDGGTVYGDGAMAGGGTLSLTAGTLSVSGNNGAMSSAVNNAAASTIILNNTAGLGNTGNITNLGTLTFDGAAGDFTKTLSEDGIVNADNASDVYLKGDNSTFSGIFNIGVTSTITAAEQSAIGTAAINIAGRFVADNTTDWTLDPANVLSGAGTLVKQNTGTLTIGHANAGLTGMTEITGGTLKLTTDNAIGSTTVTNNATLELAKGVTNFANDMSGNGVALVSGENIAVTGDNSGFTSAAQWHVTGSATVTNQNNLGDASVFLDGATSKLTLTADTAGDYDFVNELSGDGTLSVRLQDPSDEFTFNDSAKSSGFFQGTLHLENSTFNIGDAGTADQAGTNTSVLSFAILQSGMGNKTNVLGNATIGGLSFDGGTVGFNLNAAPATQAQGVVFANSHGFEITSNAGQVMLNNYDFINDPAFINPVGPDGRNILDQDNTNVNEGILLGIGHVTGSVGNLELVDQNGVAITDALPFNIEENDTLVAVGTYDYGLSTGPGSENIYANYLLKVLDLKGTGEHHLTLNNSGAYDHTLDARVTGYGNLHIVANDSQIILNNDQNDYTGETTIVSGTLVSGVDHALGSDTSYTSKLTVNSGASWNLNGHEQTIGKLDNRAGASVLLNNGKLTANDTVTSTNGLINLGSSGTFKVNAGGTISGDNSIVGGPLSLLHVDPSTLVINGANTSFHGTTQIDGGSTVILDHAYGVGQSLVILGSADDTLEFNITNAANAGASMPIGNAIQGAGVLNVMSTVPGGELYIRRSNAAFNGTARVTHGSLIVSNIAGVGSSVIDVVNDDAYYTWQNIDDTIRNLMEGSGHIVIDNSTTDIERANTAGNFHLVNGTRMTMNHVNALGTETSNVEVDPTSSLLLNVDRARLGNVTNNGQTVFNPSPAGTFKNATMTSLAGYGSLVFQVDFNRQTSDFLTINDSTSGTQTVLVNRVGELPTEGNGSIPIIRTENFISAPDAFKLPAGIDGRERIDVGSYAYTLRQGNGTTTLPDINDWYLVGDSLSKAAQSIIGTAAGMGLGWHLEMDTLLKRMGELRQTQTYGYPHGGKKGYEGWVRTYGMELNAGDEVAGTKFTEYYYGVDVGMDKSFRIEQGNYKGNLYTGLFVGGGKTDRRFNGFGTGDTEMSRLGLYATYLSDGGWYFDFVSKVSYYDNTFDSISSYLDRSHGSYNQTGAGFSIEAGKQIALKDRFFIEPQAQFSYGRIWGTSYATTGDIPLNVNIDHQDSFQGRLGVRAGRTYGFNSGILTPYVKASVASMWTDGGVVTTSDGLYRKATMDGARAEVGAGLIWDTRKAGQIYLDYEYITGERFEIPWRVNLGYRIQF